ncbi:hypothetical protein ACL02T_27810 [Pseudonocardia sp. RS010]|uniref:hypothetical protein n=1 Tax=Pseudonocardia sp. RS010 TaxID=3385979 RepID=UPI0039A2FD72
MPVPPALQGVYDQAKSEPVLTWYSSQEPALNDAVVEAFTRQHPGVKVGSLRLATGPLGVRYAQERAAGAVTAGLVTLAAPNFVDKGLSAGWFERFDETALPDLARLPDRFFAEGIATTGVNARHRRQHLRGAGPAADLGGRLAPEYKGTILLGDPRNVPSYVALARMLNE